jgi:hypothetical protein
VTLHRRVVAQKWNQYLGRVVEREGETLKHERARRYDRTAELNTR